MLLTVTHDQNGNIIGAVAHPSGTPPSSSTLKPGQHSTEIDVPEIGEDLEPHMVFERLTQVVEENVVEFADGKGTLKRKG